MTRKRNNKCRNAICACTGACFVNDGTGDFAKTTDTRIKLERLRSRMLGWEDCDHEIKELETKLSEAVKLLRESQSYIGGDWRQRRDNLLNEIEGGES